MTAPTITVGGPLATHCDTCGARRDETCMTRDTYTSRSPHAARVKAAPPEQTIAAGDLVMVRSGGTHLAQLVAIGEALSVRLWQPGRQAFASERKLPREALVSAAPEGARTDIAREELRREQAPTSPSPEGGHSVTDPLAIHVAGMPDLWSSSTTTTVRGNDEPARKGW